MIIAFLWSIWLERNNRIFDNKFLPFDRFCEQVFVLDLGWCQRFYFSSDLLKNWKTFLYPVFGCSSPFLYFISSIKHLVLTKKNIVSTCILKVTIHHILTIKILPRHHVKGKHTSIRTSLSFSYLKIKSFRLLWKLNSNSFFSLLTNQWCKKNVLCVSWKNFCI